VNHELLVEDALVDFGGVKALNGVTLGFGGGQACGVIGPNGSGKSTLLAAVSRLTDLSSGSLSWLGNEYTDAPRFVPARLGIARSFQTVRLVASATVLDNVMLGASIDAAKRGPVGNWLRLSRAAAEEREFRRRARAALERVGLEDYEGAYPGSLPYGLQRRVEIARALAADPKILLLDEPVAGMIQEERADVLGLLKQLRSEGLSLVLVEHDLSMVYELCDHVYVLNFGQLIASGAPTEVARSPEVRKAYIGDDGAPLAEQTEIA